MKKLVLICVIALALPATAAAKGPAGALIVGPGTTIRVSGAEGSATPFWRLVEATGWFEAAWGSPSHLPQEQPPAELGPRFTVSWRVPSSTRLQQELYPYAKPSPLTYMPPGQKLYGTPVRGGWFTGGAKLEKVLLRIGVPAQAPAPQPPPASAGHAPPAAQATSDSVLSAFDIAAITAGAVFVALVLFVAIRARRRPQRTIPA